MMSRKKPSPLLFTILLAMNPEMSPRMIQAMKDIVIPRYVIQKARALDAHCSRESVAVKSGANIAVL
jgi:hypothetical protein